MCADTEGAFSYVSTAILIASSATLFFLKRQINKQYDGKLALKMAACNGNASSMYVCAYTVDCNCMHVHIICTYILCFKPLPQSGCGPILYYTMSVDEECPQVGDDLQQQKGWVICPHLQRALEADYPLPLITLPELLGSAQVFFHPPLLELWGGDLLSLQLLSMRSVFTLRPRLQSVVVGGLKFDCSIVKKLADFLACITV